LLGSECAFDQVLVASMLAVEVAADTFAASDADPIVLAVEEIA